jgi:folate-binding protein YgfZ
VPTPANEYSHQKWNDAIVARISSTGAAGFRIFAPVAERDRILATFEGMPQASVEEARIVRLEHGKPRYGDEITDSTLPQESRQMHAVSFNKGCYLGQEIVERIRARGHVNRVLEKLEYGEGERPEAEIASEAFSPALGKFVALGFVRTKG